MIPSLSQSLQIGKPPRVRTESTSRKQDLTRNHKLQQRGLGHFAITKRITNTTYQFQDDKDPTIIKTVHRNHLVEYYPKKKIPALNNRGICTI